MKANENENPSSRGPARAGNRGWRAPALAVLALAFTVALCAAPLFVGAQITLDDVETNLTSSMDTILFLLLIIVAVFGVFLFVKGLMDLNSINKPGSQATLGGALTHIVIGACLLAGGALIYLPGSALFGGQQPAASASGLLDDAVQD